MCLDRKLKDPLLEAEEDIICYKCVQIPYENWFKLKTSILRFLKLIKHYQTYYTEIPIVVGAQVSASPFSTLSDLKFIEKYYRRIEGGFIHSFVSKKDAIAFAKDCSYVDVVQCVIPAGTYYFEGFNSFDNTPGFASTKIKYVKVI
jgi:hypothetical protein